MIHIAEKIGFEECCRKIGIRSVRGRLYDGLTFKLNKEKFLNFCKILSEVLQDTAKECNILEGQEKSLSKNLQEYSHI